MKYWSKGSEDHKEALKIRDAFAVLGYNTKCVWGNFCGDFLYHTLENDDRIYVAAKGTIEYDLIGKLVELDTEEYTEVDADSIVTEPIFDYNDVIYDTHKMYRRAIVTSVDRKKQQYTVKDFNNAEYNIKFSEQDGWDFVRRPAFDEETMITDGANRIYIINIEYQWQRYKVCIDGDDDTFYIDFKEQDNFRRVGFDEPL